MVTEEREEMGVQVANAWDLEPQRVPPRNGAAIDITLSEINEWAREPGKGNLQRSALQTAK